MKSLASLWVALMVVACSPAYGPGDDPRWPDPLSLRKVECPPVVQAGPALLTGPEKVEVVWSGTEFQAEIPIELHNGTQRELGLHHQQDRIMFGLQKQVDGVWTGGWDSVWTAALYPPVRVCAGGRMTDTILLWGTTRENSYPHFTTHPYPGTYRLVMESYFLDGELPAAPESLRFSEPFLLE